MLVHGGCFKAGRGQDWPVVASRVSSAEQRCLRPHPAGEPCLLCEARAGNHQFDCPWPLLPCLFCLQLARGLGGWPLSKVADSPVLVAPRRLRRRLGGGLSAVQNLPLAILPERGKRKSKKLTRSASGSWPCCPRNSNRVTPFLEALPA